MSFLETYSSKEDIQRLQAGDRTAFRKIFDEHYQRLWAFALKVTKSEYIAEEIVQEVFIKLWVHREKVDPGRSIEPYLYVMTRNFTFNYLKKAAHHDNLKEEVLRNYQISSNHTEDIILGSEFTVFLQTAIAKLTPRKKEIFQLSKIEGKSLDEISSMLGVSKKTVENQLWEATSFVKHEISRY